MGWALENGLSGHQLFTELRVRVWRSWKYRQLFTWSINQIDLNCSRFGSDTCSFIRSRSIYYTRKDVPDPLRLLRIPDVDIG